MQMLLKAVPAGERKPEPKQTRSGMSIFSHTITSSGEGSLAIAEALAERARKTTSVLEEILHRTQSYPHWGINE